MATRTVTGPVTTAAGVGVGDGTLTITPLVPAGTASDGFVVQASSAAITDGIVSANVVVPGRYKFEVFDAAGERLRGFTANISDASLEPVSLKEIWESRLDPLTLPAGGVHEGDSVLRLVPGGGAADQVLTQRDGRLSWGTPGAAGDMEVRTYDPGNRASDVFVRSNHVGTQPISSVQGLESALDTAWLGGYSEYAAVCERRPFGTFGAAGQPDMDNLRALNTVVYNNSGLTDGQLLDTGTSGVRLVAGRVYFGWAVGPAMNCVAHYLKLLSTDGTVSLRGPSAFNGNGNEDTVQTDARLDFRIVVPASPTDMIIKVYHRLRNGTRLGNAASLEAGVPEEYAHMTIFSRPI